VRSVADFLDTNIWIYAHTAGVDDAKSEAARKLLQKVEAPVISAQVLGEYSAVMIRNRLPDKQVRENIDAMIVMCRTLPVSADTAQRAWDLRARYGFSFWDCQMIAAALEAGCSRLFTEDLQHGQIIAERLSITNPFHQAAA
jgi:predicted nucleic acid-binding protein